MTEEQKQVASLEMAKALQRQLLPATPEPPSAGQGAADDATVERSVAAKGRRPATGTTHRRRSGA